MFYVANKSRESEKSAYYNFYAFLFFNLLKTIEYLVHTYNSIAIYRYSLLAILYCIAVVYIAIYRYFNILFHP